MIKLTFALTRLPSLSRAEFQDYWYNTHGPLVATVSQVLGIRRYVQLHSAPDPVSEALRASRGAPPAYDGVADGLNFVQMMTGRIAGVQRGFVISTDDDGENRLWEIVANAVDDASFDIIIETLEVRWRFFHRGRAGT